MTRYHRAFDPAYRAAVALANARRSAGLARSDSIDEVSTAIAPSSPLTDEARRRIHAALELDRALRAEVLATLTPELAGPAAWLWLERDTAGWEELVGLLLDDHDRRRQTAAELERVEQTLRQRTAQWRAVMRQLSEATAELDRLGSPLVQRSPGQPLSDTDWDEILGRDH